MRSSGVAITIGGVGPDSKIKSADHIQTFSPTQDRTGAMHTWEASVFSKPTFSRTFGQPSATVRRMWRSRRSGLPGGPRRLGREAGEQPFEQGSRRQLAASFDAKVGF